MKDDVPLSRNFWLSEFTDRPVGEVPLANLRRLARNLEIIRMRLGSRPIIITSGLRTVAQQAELIKRGVATSMHSLHLKGMACDFRIPSGPFGRDYPMLGHVLVLLQNAKLIPPGGIGIYNSHVHFDLGRTRTWDFSTQEPDDQDEPAIEPEPEPAAAEET